MGQVIVRNLEESIKRRLKRRASRHGRSMEEEIRQILRAAALEPAKATIGVGSRIAARFASTGLTEPIRELRGQTAEPADFDS